MHRHELLPLPLRFFWMHLLWVDKTKVPSTLTRALTNAQFASEAGQGDPDRKMVLH